MEDFKNKIIPLNKNEQNKLTGGFVVVSNQNVQFGASDDTNLNCHGSKLQHSTTTKTNCHLSCACNNKDCGLQINYCNVPNGIHCTAPPSK